MGGDVGLIKRLIAGGVADDLVQEVMDLQCQVYALNKRRKSDRDRQAKSRESRDKRDTCDTENALILEKVVISPEIEIEKKTVRKKEHGKRISPDWRPSEIAIAKVKAKHGFTDAEISQQADQLLNHFLAKTGAGATSTNWDLNFYNWMARQAEWRGNGRHREASAQIQRNGNRKTWHEVNRELLAKVERGESIALFPEDSDEVGDGFDGVLPRLGEG